MTMQIEGVQAKPEFLMAMGVFYGAWTSIDLTIDCALAHFLKISPQHTLLLTAGMELGRKIRLLVGLVQRSEHPKKAQLTGTLNKLQSESKRNVFAHSYVVSTREKVTFLERQSGDYRIRKHEFTLTEFQAHVVKFTKTGKEFWEASGLSDVDLRQFVDTAFREVPRG